LSPRSTQLSASASGLLVWVIMAADEGVIGAFQRLEQGHGGGRVLEVGQRMDRVRNRCAAAYPRGLQSVTADLIFTVPR